METRFTQKDYFLYRIYYDKVLEFFKRALGEMDRAEKKPLLYYRTQKTLEHLKEESGKNLTPYDVDNIVYTLLSQIKKKKG